MTSLLAKIRTAESDALNRYLVVIRFNNKILGGVASSPDILTSSIISKLKREAQAAKAKGLDFFTPEQIEEIAGRQVADQLGGYAVDELAEASVDEIIESARDQGHNVFARDEIGIYIGHYQMKACLRDIITSVGLTVAKRGSKQTMQHLLHTYACNAYGVPLEGTDRERLRLYADALCTEMITDAHGILEKPIHVMTRQGQRSTITRSDFVERPYLRFGIGIAANIENGRKSAAISDDDIATALLHAQDNGLGAKRSQGYGQFVVIEAEKVTDNPAYKPASKPASKQ